MNAEQIMTTDVATVEETATIGEALEILASLDVRHLPVTRAGELVGMVSDRDLRDYGLSMLADLADLDRIAAARSKPVSEIMSSDLLTVDPAASAEDIINLMAEEKVGAVPVVDGRDNSLVGLVSYVDVLRAAARLLGDQ